jgi:putative transposase
MSLNDWPHAPIHRLEGAGIYMITGATLHKERLFNTPEKLSSLQTSLLSLARQYEWKIQAWAMFANHYHMVVRGSPEGRPSLKKFLQHLHSESARNLNSSDHASGRRVWYNFWDTKLTYQRSYLARLKYVHQNAVKHGLVRVANQYPWCSAAWFERTAPPAIVKTIYSFKTDKLRIDDDY